MQEAAGCRRQTSCSAHMGVHTHTHSYDSYRRGSLTCTTWNHGITSTVIHYPCYSAPSADVSTAAGFPAQFHMSLAFHHSTWHLFIYGVTSDPALPVLRDDLCRLAERSLVLLRERWQMAKGLQLGCEQEQSVKTAEGIKSIINVNVDRADVCVHALTHPLVYTYSKCYI